MDEPIEDPILEHFYEVSGISAVRGIMSRRFHIKNSVWDDGRIEGDFRPARERMLAYRDYLLGRNFECIEVVVVTREKLSWASVDKTAERKGMG